MALSVSQINQYIPALSKDMATKAVADAVTAKLLASAGQLQVGIKGKAAIVTLSQDVNLQDGSTCGARNPLGTTGLGNGFITVAPIKDESNICPKTLYNSYNAYAIAKGQDPRNETLLPDFLRNIFELKAAELNLAVENLLWNGDTTITGTSNLKYIDGILKQVLAGSYIAISDTGATIVEKLQNVYSSMPVAVRTKSNFRIFIGQDSYDAYTIALANKNLFRLPGDYTLQGTSAILVPVSGLNGSNLAVAARLSNFQLGMDGDSEVDKVIMNFSVETNQWYVDYHFAVGIAVIFPSEVGYGSIA